MLLTFGIFFETLLLNYSLEHLVKDNKVNDELDVFPNFYQVHLVVSFHLLTVKNNVKLLFLEICQPLDSGCLPS